MISNNPNYQNDSCLPQTVELRTLLSYISLELESIAAQNDLIQNTLQEILEKAVIESKHIERIQGLDLVSQKKRDISTLLNVLSRTLESDEGVPYATIASSLKLESLRNSFSDGRNAFKKSSESGSVDIF